MTIHHLETRAGLPDALRVLLEEYPKTDWEHDPSFDGLLRFWLDRHLMFRKIITQLNDHTEEFLNGSLSERFYAAHLGRFGGIFVDQLHAHHTIEDTQYFPKLIDLDDRISSGFDILDKDHHAIDGHLNTFIETANGVLMHREQTEQMKTAAEAFRKHLVQLEGLLNRHLIDEEELVVPVILKYGAPDM